MNVVIMYTHYICPKCPHLWSLCPFQKTISAKIQYTLLYSVLGEETYIILYHICPKCILLWCLCPFQNTSQYDTLRYIQSQRKTYIYDICPLSHFCGVCAHSKITSAPYTLIHLCSVPKEETYIISVQSVHFCGHCVHSKTFQHNTIHFVILSLKGRN